MYRFVNKGIVDVIVGEMFFHPDDENDETTKARSLVVSSRILLDPRRTRRTRIFRPIAIAL